MKVNVRINIMDSLEVSDINLKRIREAKYLIQAMNPRAVMMKVLFQNLE
jgi:hypothetical protein